MKSPESIRTITKIAREYALEPAALLAICHVESGGKVFARVGGRQEPLIRFEGHYFDRRLSGNKRMRARREKLASPKAGAIANPRTQAGRWALLRRAEAIDRRAARESVSWGLGQVMGAHWAWLGYGSVDDLVEEARCGLSGQVSLMVRYIRKAGLEKAIRVQNWAEFARGYNGPGYRKYRYDTKITAAYQRYAGMQFETGDTFSDHKVLQRGAKGQAVADLQRQLSAVGYALKIDGDFGPATETALKKFQRGNKIEATGTAGQTTLDALGQGLPFSRGGHSLWQWLTSALAGLLGKR
ncbi:MAG: N-acetylmuramidase domain-containing protein [Rhizobiaceae bacterium]